MTQMNMLDRILNMLDLIVITTLLLLQNGKLYLDILTYQRQHDTKSNFVNMIGYHDATYLTLLIAILFSLVNVADAIYNREPLFLVNLGYIFYVLLVFAMIVDRK